VATLVAGILALIVSANRFGRIGVQAQFLNVSCAKTEVMAPDDRMVSLTPPSLSAQAKHGSKNRGISAESAIALAL